MKHKWSVHRLRLKRKSKIKKLIDPLKAKLRTSKIKASFFKKYNGSFVYIWKRNKEYLYIGVSNAVLGRIFYGHNVIGVKDTFKDSDYIELIKCTDLREAEFLEACLIVYHKPKYNLSGVIKPHGGGHGRQCRKVRKLNEKKKQ